MGRGPPSHASEQMHPSHFQNDAIGTSRHFPALRNLVGRYRGIPDSGQPNDPVDLWVHGLL